MAELVFTRVVVAHASHWLIPAQVEDTDDSFAIRSYFTGLADATPAAGATTAVPVEGLNSPENVARFFAFLLLETGDD